MSKTNKERNNKAKLDAIKREKKQKEKQRKRILLIIILILLLLGINACNRLFKTPTKPAAELGDGKWYTKKTVAIVKESKARRGIKYYTYCISKDKSGKNCKWIKTATKDVEVSGNGTKYIFFKAIGKDGTESEMSDPVEVKIDNKEPVIIDGKVSSTKSTIKVEIEALDNESGIDKYYYKIDNEKWISSDESEYVFTGLKEDTLYKITVRVVDKLGNTKEMDFNIKTLTDTNEEDKDNVIPDIKNKPQPEGTITEIPEISLANLPMTFYYGDSYNLPSSYKFGKSGGVVSCTVGSNLYKNTSTIPIGSWTVKCEARSNTGVVSRVSKDITVKKYVNNSKPEIKLNTTEPAKQVKVNIDYKGNSASKKYMLENANGTKTAWLDYKGALTITENNTTIYAYGVDSNGNKTTIVSKKITNIDLDSPTLNVNADFETPTRKLTVSLVGEDDFGIKEIGYIKGDKTLQEVKSQGNVVKGSVTSFDALENGKYTVYTEDKAGNVTIRVITITNIDNEAPDISINVLTEEFGTEAEVEIDYGDSVTKEYKIGKNGVYTEYTGRITLKSEELLELANDDYSITIYAKGKDSLGNESEVSEKTYILDLDMPKKPKIIASNKYPILSNYKISFDDTVSIEYDDRNDITNYYSTDGGLTWKLYTSSITATSSKVIAKSVKASGLTVKSDNTTVIPGDAMPKSVYDSKFNGINVGNIKDKYIEVANDMIGKNISLVWSGDMKVVFLDTNKDIISQEDYNMPDESSTRGAEYIVQSLASDDSYGVQVIGIPANTKYITFSSESNSGTVSEIIPYKGPTLETEDGVDNVYPHITASGIVAQSKLNVNDLYGGELVYEIYKYSGDQTGPDYYLGQNIMLGAYDAIVMYRFDDDYAYVSGLLTALADDAVPKDVYDGNVNSGRVVNQVDGTRYFKIDGNMDGKALSVSWQVRNHAADYTGVDYLYAVFKDSSGKETVKAITTTSTGLVTNKVNIPSGAISVGLYTTATVDIYEVAVDNSTSSSSIPNTNTPAITTQLVDSPNISVSNKDDYSPYKMVDIAYPSGYTNQYSFDLENWYSYEGNIKIDSNRTIYARCVKDGKVVSSSSYKITKIDSREGTISLDELPNEIEEGTSYNLPSRYSFENISGGVAKCYINDNEVANTLELSAGNYEITCIATTNAGIQTRITKELKVLEKVVTSSNTTNLEEGDEDNEEETNENVPNQTANLDSTSTEENKE